MSIIEVYVAVKCHQTHEFMHMSWEVMYPKYLVFLAVLAKS